MDAPVRLDGVGKRSSGMKVLEDVSLELRYGSPLEARADDIATIAQELALVPSSR